MRTTLSQRLLVENEAFPRGSYVHDPHAGLVCCAIPKNACSTVKRWMLQRLDPASASDDRADVHRVCRDRFSLAPLDDAAANRVAESCFRFVFIRDPFTRLASAFIDKFAGPQVHELVEGAIEVMEDVARWRGVDVRHDTTIKRPDVTGFVEIPACSRVDYERGITFREFVTHVCAAPDEHMDLHWRPQSSFLGLCPFDLVAKVDAVSDILPAMSRHLGIDPPIKLRHNPTFYTDDMIKTDTFDIPSGELRRRWVRPHADLLFSPDLRERVRQRYLADAELYERASTGLESSHRERLQALTSRMQGSPG